MPHDPSGWRSSAGYDHVEDLTASDLAWEWLRRNDDYAADYRALNEAQEEGAPTLAQMRDRWGLRFPARSVPGTSGRAGLLGARGRYRRRCAGRGAGRAAIRRGTVARRGHSRGR
ncbi:transcriptional regulator domain-containing protein [Paracoccus aurantiacus]|uniref:transcriptional regulator domain-containing protein n=1 Tax=Paracoccus aurantiacus TaxID=2599412 RepID=UPI00363E90A4